MSEYIIRKALTNLGIDRKIDLQIAFQEKWGILNMQLDQEGKLALKIKREIYALKNEKLYWKWSKDPKEMWE